MTTDHRDQIPHAPDAERAVIGALLLNQSVPEHIRQRLKPGHLFTPANRKIYEVLLALDGRGVKLDPVQVAEELRARGELDAVGSYAYIAASFDGAVRGDLDGHVDRAIDTAGKRKLWTVATRAAEAANNGHTSAQVVEMLRQAIEGFERAEEKQGQPLLNVVRMADVEAQKVSWLWPNRIALRAITILEGIEGEGKSTLLAALTAGITQGRGLPETEPGEPGNVVWLSAEDDLSQVLKPRLEAAGADCARVFAIGEPFTLDEKGLLGLRAAIAEHEPQLVVIDPIFAYTRGDANKGNDARALTGELKMIADQFDCAIVIVRHVGKSKGLGDPRAAGLYSIEWRAAARGVLLAGADPDNPQKRALTQTKNNLGPKAGSIGYVIESDAQSPSGARFFWTGESDLTAERILEAAGHTEETSQESNAKDDAEDFLRVVLGDGPRLATDVEREAREAKISMATLRRAKDSLAVRSRKFGGKFGGDSKWYWTLPEDAHAEDAQGSLKMLTHSSLERLQANHSSKGSYSNDLAEDAHAAINEHLQGQARCSDEHLQADFDPILAAIER
ncbi:MAG: AAA family ATPase [Blastocatellales bacterium]